LITSLLKFQIESTTPDDIESIGSLLLDLSTLRVATGDFSEHKRLGEGGFGVVYKVSIRTLLCNPVDFLLFLFCFLSCTCALPLFSVFNKFQGGGGGNPSNFSKKKMHHKRY